MATREEMFTALRAADALGATEDARRIAQMIAATPKASAAPADTAEGMSTTDKVLTGIGGGLSKMRDAMFPPGSPIDAITMSQTGDNGRARKDDLTTYERNKADLGTAGAVGEAIPEVVASAVPISRAGSAVSRVPLLVKALGRLAPAAGDIAANAGYAAATADEGNRASAALAGGVGAAGGRALMKTLGAVGSGARSAMSPEARTLIDAGIPVTPGQMAGDGVIGRIVRSTEDKMTSAPIAGSIVSDARQRSMDAYNNVEINRAMSPLGKKVSGAGEDTVQAAQQAISDAYDHVLPHTFISPQKAAQAVQKAQTDFQKIPLLTDEQEGKIIQYVARKVQPQIAAAAQSGQPIPGRVAKDIDAEIGHYAREFSAASDPSQHALGEAFYTLQSSLRDSLEGTTPEATRVLSKVNDAYRQMLPIVKASDRAMAQGGKFTPLQLNRASGQFGQDGSELNQAARRVLPSTIPNSGTADRLGIAAAVAAPLKTAAFTAGAAVLYSRPGIYLLTNGLRGALPDSVIQSLRQLPPERAVQAIEELGRQNPAVGQLAASLVPQITRQLATESQQ